MKGATLALLRVVYIVLGVLAFAATLDAGVRAVGFQGALRRVLESHVAAAFLVAIGLGLMARDPRDLCPGACKHRCDTLPSPIFARALCFFWPVDVDFLDDQRFTGFPCYCGV